MLKRSVSPYAYHYWEYFLSLIFKYKTRCYLLSRPSFIENVSHSCVGIKEFAKAFPHFSKQRGLICNVTKHSEDIALTKQLLRHVHEEIEDPKVCELVVAEIISKVVAYRSLPLDEEISIPILTKQGKMALTTYVVDRHFDLWNRVSAFGLTPKKNNDAAPLLLFRGTDLNLLSESGRSSIISDFDPEGPGKTLYDYAASSIKAWLENVCRGKKRARIYGHSLGGAFVTYAIIHEHQFISTKEHEPSYAFNFPGVSSNLKQAWDAIPENRRPHFTGFVSRGDLISKFGNLFGEVFELSLGKRLRPILAHEQLYFAQKECYVQMIDVERENSDTHRLRYSKIQRDTAKTLSAFGLKRLFPHKG